MYCGAPCIVIVLVLVLVLDVLVLDVLGANVCIVLVLVHG